jgi:hypothetical protein
LRQQRQSGPARPTFPDAAAWQALATEQQAAFLRQWVQSVNYDGPTGQVTILLSASQDDASPSAHAATIPEAKP